MTSCYGHLTRQSTPAEVSACQHFVILKILIAAFHLQMKQPKTLLMLQDDLIICSRFCFLLGQGCRQVELVDSQGLPVHRPEVLSTGQ